MRSNRFYAHSGKTCVRHLIDTLPFDDLATVLDLGCGTGHVARALARRYQHLDRIVALDRNTQVVEDLAQALRLEKEQAGETCRILPVAADAHAIPLPSGTIDCVICRHSFHHFIDPDTALSEIKRVLAPSGIMAMIDVMAPEDPLLQAFINHVARLSNPGNVKYYTLAELEGMLRDSNLTPSVLAKSVDYVTPISDYYERFGGNGWHDHIDDLVTLLLHADDLAKGAFHIQGATPDQLSLSLPEVMIVCERVPEGAADLVPQEHLHDILELSPAS